MTRYQKQPQLQNKAANKTQEARKYECHHPLMEPCFTSWTGFRVVSIPCVRSYEETQHNQMRASAKITGLDLSCPRHRLGASGSSLCLHAQSCCRSDLVDNTDAHARCEPLRNPSSRQHGSPSKQVRFS